jgi:hypothetical protein
MRTFYLSWILLVLLPLGAKAQHYVGLGEKELRAKLKKETRRFQQEAPSVNKPSENTFRFTAMRSKRVSMELLCDSAGSCYAEKYISRQESDALLWQKKILSAKEYGWQKLNENQHISFQERQRLLEVYRQDSLWVVQVLRTGWSPLQYQMLFSNQ